jgi:hypothetical protein
MRSRLFWISLAIVSCVLFSLSLVAQSTSSLQGTVTDPTGAVVPGAQVHVRNMDTGLERSVVTDSAGKYLVASVPPGRYTVDVQAQGMQKQVFTGVVLAVNRTTPLDVQVNVSQASTVVEVTGQTPVIESTTMTVGQVISPEVVQEVPLNGRHFVDLGLLIPGSVTPPQAGFLTAPLRGQGSFAFNTAGNREDTVNFMINGINLNDMVQNQITFQPGINTVSEFKVDNSSYSAEYGRNSGAITNIATRSGTNEFHGEVYDYLRNNYFDARNFFNPVGKQQSPFKRNQFGGDIGGPIFKNKTFFFFSYEGLRQRQGITINSGVPTDAQRATATNATVQQLLALVPHANDATGTKFVGSATAPVNIDQWTGDISHNLSDRDRLHGYYAFQRDKRQEPTLQGNTIPGFGDTRASHRQLFTLVETHVISSHATNEARLGFNRISINFSPNLLVNPLDFGINDGNTTAVGLPQISITDINLNFGGPQLFPQGRNDTTGVFSDTVSVLRGNHSIKFGGEVRRFANVNFNGDAGLFTFGTLSSFLLGQASSFQVTPGNRPSRIYVNAVGTYLEDSWKVRRGFTLELGARFDWNGTPTEGANRFVVFDPATVSLVRVGSPGFGDIYKQNFYLEPRAGFAWDVRGNGHTVLRVGYGLQADQPVTNMVSPLASNPPFAIPLVLTVTTPSPALTFANAATAAGASGLAPVTVPHNLRNAYVQSYNLNVQQQITPTIGLQIGYFGNKASHLRIARNINQPLVLGALTTSRPFPALSLSSPIDPGVPLNNIQLNDSVGNSNYNALWVTAVKNFSRGLQFNTSYTWSKTLDYNSLSSQNVILQDSSNPRNNYGTADFDARHRLVFSGIYSLPFKGSRLNTGWQLSGILQLQSGNPFTVVTSSNANGTIRTLRPNLLGPVPTGLTILPTGFVQYIPQAICSTPVAGCLFQVPTNAFGNMGRNSIYGPGFEDIDLALIKDTKMTERTTIQFRADAFNILNHPNFGQPTLPGTVLAAIGSNLASPGTFGQINSTRFPVGDVGSSRQLQLALKLIF